MNYTPTWAFMVDHAIRVLTHRHEYTQEAQDIVVSELRRLAGMMDELIAKEQSMKEVPF